MTVKVLHIINHLKLGGAQVCLKNLVENTSTEQVIPYIYPLRTGDNNNINADIIQHHRINYSPLKLLDIIRICRNENIDIIHAHLNKSIIIAILASLFCNVKVIAHEHGPIVRKGLQFTLYRILLKLLRAKVTHFIAVSQFIKLAMIQHCKIDLDKISVIYNALDLNKFQPNQSARQKIREQLNINDSDIALGYCGRLNTVKGADLLCPALHSLHKAGHKFYLIIAGSGTLAKQIETQAQSLGLSNHIHMLGFRNDIPDVISAFDLAVHLSRQEAFGLSVVEYFSGGIPVISTNVEGLAEIAKDNETAIVLNNLTPDSITDKVIKLVSDEKLKKQIVTNAKEFSRQFSINNQIEQITSLYNQAL